MYFCLLLKNRDNLATLGSHSQMSVGQESVAILLKILIPCPLGLQCYYLHVSLNLSDLKSTHVYDIRQWSHSIFLNRMSPYPANISWTVLLLLTATPIIYGVIHTQTYNQFWPSYSVPLFFCHSHLTWLHNVLNSGTVSLLFCSLSKIS